MSTVEISLEEKLAASLSKKNIDRQILATLLRGDSPEQLAGALFIVSTLLKEALDLLSKSQDRIASEGKFSKTMKYLFDATEQHRRRGLMFETKRKKGSFAELQIHINELVAANPNLKAKELMRLADKEMIVNISSRTFSNKVSIARNPKN